MRLAETYLGDGVYASFDGYQIWLRTPREGGDHSIALESEVYSALLEFAAKVQRDNVAAANLSAKPE